MGHESLRIASERFSWTAAIARLLDVYAEVLPPGEILEA